MLDDLHSDGRADAPRPVPDPKRPLTDREVPLGPTTPAIADAVHAWLDGDEPEPTARRADARDVEFWKRLDADLAQRRSRRTPPGLEARIMARLPMQTPQLITPWWHREMVVTPSTALMAALALTAAVATATALLLR